MPHTASIAPTPACTGPRDTRAAHGAPAAARCAAPMKNPKWRCACTPAAAPNIMAVFMHRIATGSVQLGESFNT